MRARQPGDERKDAPGSEAREDAWRLQEGFGGPPPPPGVPAALWYHKLRQHALARRASQAGEVSAGGREQTAVSNPGDGGGGETGGQALPPPLRVEMEQRLGADLAAVRIHEDSPRVGGSVRAVSEGTEIHFAAGAYQPEQAEGRRLLAHELAHVAQRQVTGGLELMALGGGEGRALLEADAEQAAEVAARGETAEVRLQAPAQLALRYDSWEHVEAGDAGARSIRLPCGLVLSYGEVVALAGDFYREPAQLMKAPREEVERLLALIRRQQQQVEANRRRHGGAPRFAQPSAAEAARNEKDFEQATAWREALRFDEQHHYIGRAGQVAGAAEKTYSSMADDNKDHFAGANLNRWQELHGQALQLAHAARQRGAGGPDPALLEQAYLNDAFACHYLTDAFAAGHLVSGQEGRDWGAEFWDEHHGAILLALVRAAQDDRIPSPFALLGEVAKLKARSLTLKLVHDRLGEQGLRVRNKAGHEWTIYGDRNLARSPETLQLMQQAVRLSRAEVDAAAQGKALPPSLRPTDLAPSEVAYADKDFTPIVQFVLDRQYFRYVLGWLLVDQTRNNRLYQLIKANLGFAGTLGGEKAANAGRVVGAGVEILGEAMDDPLGPPR